MRNIKNKVWTITVVIFALSCNKETSNSNSQKLPSIIELKNIQDKNRSGIIALTLNQFDDESKSVAPVIEASFNDEKIPNNFKNMGTLNFGGFKLNADAQNLYQGLNDVLKSTEKKEYLKGLYGKVVAFSVVEEVSATNVTTRGADVGIAGEIYIPKIMDGNLQKGNKGSINRNTTLTWTPDLQNTKGVYIMVEFYPLDLKNKDFRNKKGRKIAIQTEDDGNYKFSGNDFRGIPANATVSLTWGRGNFVEVNRKSSKPVIVLGYSTKEYRNSVE